MLLLVFLVFLISCYYLFSHLRSYLIMEKDLNCCTTIKPTSCDIIPHIKTTRTDNGSFSLELEGSRGMKEEIQKVKIMPKEENSIRKSKENILLDVNSDSSSIGIQDLNFENREDNAETSPYSLLSVEAVSHIESQLTKHERISIGFLFFDNIDVSFKYCCKSPKRQFYRGLKKFAEKNPPEEWSMKILECLYLIKNYYLLEMYGFEKFVAADVFKKKSKLLPERVLLYKICDSLTKDETQKVMNSVPTLQKEDYLEIFFLKVVHQWDVILEVLNSFKDPALLRLVADLKVLLSNKAYVKMPSSSNEATVASCDVYPIKNPENVGLCLIINQFMFKSLALRSGSEKDVESLRSIMSELFFDVKVIDNVTQRAFGVTLLSLIRNNFKEDHSVLFLVILSHGSEGKIYCSDDSPVLIEDILKILHAVPLLRDIPKVFIIQACQGDKYLLSDKTSTDGILPENVNTDLGLTPELRKQIGEYISDAFIVLSSVPGFKSFRHIDTGSNFIQFLCHCLRKNPNENFYDIITEVIRLVNEAVEPTKIPNLCFTQQPECRSLFKKKLYLRPVAT